MMKRPLEKLGLWLAREYIEIMERDCDQRVDAHAAIANNYRVALEKAQEELAVLRRANELLTDIRDRLKRELNEQANTPPVQISIPSSWKYEFVRVDEKPATEAEGRT